MRLVVKVVIAGVVSYAAYRAARLIAPDGVGAFVEQVRRGMADREAQLREALGLEVATAAPEHPARHGAAGNGTNGGNGTRPPLTPDAARALLDDPAGPGPAPRAPQE